MRTRSERAQGPGSPSKLRQGFADRNGKPGHEVGEQRTASRMGNGLVEQAVTVLTDAGATFSRRGVRGPYPSPQSPPGGIRRGKGSELCIQSFLASRMAGRAVLLDRRQFHRCPASFGNDRESMPSPCRTSSVPRTSSAMVAARRGAAYLQRSADRIRQRGRDRPSRSPRRSRGALRPAARRGGAGRGARRGSGQHRQGRPLTRCHGVASPPLAGNPCNNGPSEPMS